MYLSVNLHPPYFEEVEDSGENMNVKRSNNNNKELLLARISKTQNLDYTHLWEKNPSLATD